MNKYCFFYISLVQDVQIFRSFIQLFELMRPEVQKYLVLDRFLYSRDTHSIAYNEISNLVSEFSCKVIPFKDDFFEILSMEADFEQRIPFFFASESSAAPHTASFFLAKSLPNCFTTFTVQHGTECLGFKHTDRMSDLFGTKIEFAGDFILGWSDIQKQNNATMLTKKKYIHIGFTNNLFERLTYNQKKTQIKRSCKFILLLETLKSDRVESIDKSFNSFLQLKQNLKIWCADNGYELLIKPHPTTVFSNEFPSNSVTYDYLGDLPVDQILFAIATPSTVYLDCLSLNIPVYIWSHDIYETECGDVPCIRHLTDLDKLLQTYSASVAKEVEYHSSPDILNVDPKLVAERIMQVVNPFFNSQNFSKIAKSIVFCDQQTATEGIIFNNKRNDIAKNHIIFLEKAYWEQNYGLVAHHQELFRMLIDGTLHFLNCREIFISRLFTPELPQFLSTFDLKIVYFIDDNLLNVPYELGLSKFEYFNSDEIKNSILNHLRISNSIITSTKYLASKLPSDFSDKVKVIEKYVGNVKLPFFDTRGPIDSNKTIAFFGTDHTHDFKDCFLALERVLTLKTDLVFINIGGTRLPKSLEYLPNVKTFNIKMDYGTYTALIRSIPIYIGLAPLNDLDFNCCKADTKFVEYTACNAVTVSNNKYVYPYSFVVPTTNDERSNSDLWFEALEKLLANRDLWNEHLSIAKEVVFGEKAGSFNRFKRAE